MALRHDRANLATCQHDNDETVEMHASRGYAIHGDISTRLDHWRNPVSEFTARQNSRHASQYPLHAFASAKYAVSVGSD